MPFARRIFAIFDASISSLKSIVPTTLLRCSGFSTNGRANGDASAQVYRISAEAPASARGRVQRLSEAAWRKDAPAVKALAAAAAVALLAGAPPGPDFRDIAKEAGLTDSFPNGGDKTKEY